jgi:hypothetical protein
VGSAFCAENLGFLARAKLSRILRAVMRIELSLHVLRGGSATKPGGGRGRQYPLTCSAFPAVESISGLKHECLRSHGRAFLGKKGEGRNCTNFSSQFRCAVITDSVH